MGGELGAESQHLSCLPKSYLAVPAVVGLILMASTSFVVPVTSTTVLVLGDDGGIDASTERQNQDFFTISP